MLIANNRLYSAQLGLGFGLSLAIADKYEDHNSSLIVTGLDTLSTQ